MELYLGLQGAAEQHLSELPGAAEAFLGPDDVEVAGDEHLAAGREDAGERTSRL